MDYVLMKAKIINLTAHSGKKAGKVDNNAEITEGMVDFHSLVVPVWIHHLVSLPE